MTELLYLTDSYLKECEAKVISVNPKGDLAEIILDKTVFYPQGGGQQSDIGVITGNNSQAIVKHVRLSSEGLVVHESKISGVLKIGDLVKCTIDWNTRFNHMRAHSAGHVVHEAVQILCPGLKPIKANHGKDAFMQYAGSITMDKRVLIENEANRIVDQKLEITAKFVDYDKLVKLAEFVPEHLPKNKPLRIVTISNYQAVPDGGTQVHNSSEIGNINISKIVNESDIVTVFYSIDISANSQAEDSNTLEQTNAAALISCLIEFEQDSLKQISVTNKSAADLRLELFGKTSEFAQITKKLGTVPKTDKARVGVVVKEVKNSIESQLESLNLKKTDSTRQSDQSTLDTTAPGTQPPLGHLHIVTQAISEITRIFERIGFTRVRHPEVDWDYYTFEALNMPPNHPARDEWETFHIKYQTSKIKNTKFKKIVLTPHTSNGQVREMEKGIVPIRMINIAKCYRRQSDISHSPMFHQFEGLFIDKNVSIANLKGVCDYFFSQFYGPDRISRLRPFHFQFTEPSFEIDVNCGICDGSGILENGEACRMCKEGWLELGGAGMVHPNVLRAGGLDPDIYSGFAFGWGVERTYMMKSGIKIDDIRILYENDIRFLEQF
jgi:phenylalanyl-tRNA synthetase alpha chain